MIPTLLMIGILIYSFRRVGTMMGGGMGGGTPGSGKRKGTGVFIYMLYNNLCTYDFTKTKL